MYNGDPDGFNAIYSSIGGSGAGYVYDDFIVPAGQTWSVTGLFGNFAMDSTTSSAYWEIRSGVAAGIGGTLLDSGTSRATQVDTGKSLFGFVEISTVSVSGLSGIALPGGAAGTTYWLTIAPVVSDFAYITTTNGANAIGNPAGNDGNSYLAGEYWTGNYPPSYTGPESGLSGSDFEVGSIGTTSASGGEPNFSYGVTGSVVGRSGPEPPSAHLFLWAIALVGAGLGSDRFRRLIRRPAWRTLVKPRT